MRIQSEGPDTMPKITDEKLEQVTEQVFQDLAQNASIKNEQLRTISGIDYDQATDFFNRMVANEKLRRVGVRGGTKYVLP